VTDKCGDCRSDRALFVLLLALVIALELSCACWAVWPLVVGGAR
jgi:hypothetical protein